MKTRSKKINNYTTVLSIPFLLKDLKDLVSLLKEEKIEEYSHLKKYIPAIEEHISGCSSSVYEGKVAPLMMILK